MTSFIRQYDNCCIDVQPIAETSCSPSIKHVLSKDEIKAMRNNYPKFFQNLVPESQEEIQKKVNIFKGATAKKVTIALTSVTSDHSLVTIMPFINGNLLDIKKLPNPPLDICAETINGQPIHLFTIPPKKNKDH